MIFSVEFMHMQNQPNTRVHIHMQYLMAFYKNVRKIIKFDILIKPQEEKNAKIMKVLLMKNFENKRVS